MRRANVLLAVVVFAALTLVVGLQVLNRFVLHLPLIWSEEVARFLFFWVVMLGAGLSVLDRRHFTLDITMGWRPAGRRARLVFDLLPNFAVLAFGVFLLVVGVAYVPQGLLRTATNSGVNMGVVYAAIPVFALLTVAYSLQNLVHDLRAGGPQAPQPPAAE